MPPRRGYLPARPQSGPRPDSQGVREGAESRRHGRKPPPGAVHAAVAVAAARDRAGRGGRSAAVSGPAPQAPGDEAKQSKAPHRRPRWPPSPPGPARLDLRLSAGALRAPSLAGCRENV